MDTMTNSELVINVTTCVPPVPDNSITVPLVLPKTEILLQNVVVKMVGSITV
jgi:hypothetical protein